MNSGRVMNIIVLKAISLQSNGTLYDNSEDDMSKQILYISDNKEQAKKEFAKTVKQEKENSWYKDCCPNGMANYSYIETYESENEFYCKNNKTNEVLHLQLVRKEITNKNE